MVTTPENQNGQSVPIVGVSPAATVVVGFNAATSTASAALPAGVYILNPTKTCYVNFGAAANKAGNGFRLSADSMFALLVPSGTVNVIGDEAGSLYITPVR